MIGFFSASPLDLAIIFGSSEPNSVKKINAQRAFIKSALEKLEISKTEVLPAFVSHGKPPVLNSRIGEITDKATAIRLADAVPNSRDSGYSASALQLINDTAFAPGNGARLDVPKSIIIFVDKKDIGDSRVINELAKQFKEEGTKLVIIGIGKDVHKDALKPLVHNNGAIFFPPNLEEMQRIVDPVVAAIKQGKHCYVCLISSIFCYNLLEISLVPEKNLSDIIKNKRLANQVTFGLSLSCNFKL